ncbi:MAG TPA: neutral zinc metallopeptidase [Candidatus Kapabacteria bacterium]|nr:neutral zinc metallopeptidase [Candidatus Kapabacteria bacterium]
MRWTGGRQSINVEDRRGAGGMAIGGGIGSIVIALIVYLLGGDPSIVTDQAPAPSQTQTRSGQGYAPTDDSLKQFVSVVLAETEDTWNALFQQQGMQYKEPRLVLFTQQVQSACGMAGAAVGPFYCPLDSKVYIDLSFYRQLRERLGAPGDFAQAYVIAHEIGHHVQNLLGISDQVQQAQRRSSKAEANELSVRLELQADYLAGVWAHHAQKEGILDPGDLEEAMTAASAIGDDKLQMESQGYVVPDAFTHGTSEQRARWFRRGVESGSLEGGDTFAADAL